MDIKKLIQQEAPEADKNDIHDSAYAKALQKAYDQFKNDPFIELKYQQKFARESYDGSHQSTARCTILYALIKELLDEKTNRLSKDRR